MRYRRSKITKPRELPLSLKHKGCEQHGLPYSMQSQRSRNNPPVLRVDFPSDINDCPTNRRYCWRPTARRTTGVVKWKSTGQHLCNEGEITI
jgi:hypothetical protein